MMPHDDEVLESLEFDPGCEVPNCACPASWKVQCRACGRVGLACTHCMLRLVHAARSRPFAVCATCEQAAPLFEGWICDEL